MRPRLFGSPCQIPQVSAKICYFLPVMLYNRALNPKKMFFGSLAQSNGILAAR